MSSLIASVLILDDEPAVAASLARLDLGQAVTVRTATRWQEAERLLSEQTFEVVLVDEHLAHGDPAGLEALRRIHQHDEDVYRIVMTGDTDPTFAIRAINAGRIDAFLSKPWEDEHAVQLIHQGVETSLLRRHNRSLLQELSTRNHQLLGMNSRLEELVVERTAHLEEANAQLLRQQQQLVRLETVGVVGFVARGMAHELNNPLAAILGYAQRLRRGSSEADTCRRLDVIITEVERCRQLVDQLRSLGTTLDEAITSVDVTACLREAVADRLNQQLPCPGIVATDPPPRVQAAKRSLIRIIDEVLDNASAAGARSIRLSGGVDGRRVRLVFSNDGQRPSEREAADATKPFFTTRAASGRRGLGLAVAAGLLRDQEGHIELLPLDDPPGAQLIIQLPPARQPLPTPTAQPIFTDNAPRRPVFLVVDDEEVVRELLCELLNEADCETIPAGRVSEALAALDTRRIDAVITDQHLPDGTGIQLIEQCSAMQPRLHGHLALCTGSAGGIELPPGILILPKPFHLHQVEALAKRLAAT